MQPSQKRKRRCSARASFNKSIQESYPVDLYKAIRELVEERKRIDRIIASLEAMLAKGKIPGLDKPEKSPGKRRGRKDMGPEERKQVSERMARYWAVKRAENRKAPPAHDGAGSQPRDPAE